MEVVRPDYIKCVLRPVASATTSWCDRSLALEWHFKGLDHVAAERLNDGRLLPCMECIEAAIHCLTLE